MRVSALRFAAALALGVLPCAGAAGATFSVVNTDDGGPGSLRQAILDANAHAAAAPAEANAITFAIPGNGPFRIAPPAQARLPNLRGTLTIDGYTQAGSRPNVSTPDDGGLDGRLQIEIHGPGSGYGLVLDSGAAATDVTLRGIVLNGFQWQIGGGSANSRLTVHGCYLGTTIDGSAVDVASSAACLNTVGTTQIGGVLPEQRNLIANCGNGAIAVGNHATVVEGNLIGTDAAGEREAIGGNPQNAGIIVSTGGGAQPRLRIGGPTAAARNVISGHRGGGIRLSGTGSGDAFANVVIQGNFIGTDWSGTRAIPNGAAEAPQFTGGIVFWRSASDDSATVIGGFAPGEANRIAYNHGAGLFSREGHVSESFDNRGNVIHHNRGIGRADVDIAPTGPSPNDAGDVDDGANNRQNWPEILSAGLAGDQLSLSYRVDSRIDASAYPLRIDFYENVQGGSGALLGQDSYPAGSAQQPRAIVLTVRPGAKAIPLVAVATDANGYSSEFSPAFDVIFEDDFD